ncbi:Hypothetical protein LEPBI_I0214 [Leptospira biflexa serovar Patoc strain 'Patoc 1 (Paris)']|uniref:Uncharacterized protein n=1 Tax=Leptospira biflexa serovar Patoc (strain Patoc 1 / ATCC 23582 / Paris) TaxID=456481 RepID=B0SKB8_LEPBP|nr:Hypothetical protein LEPBI_I0214 [Leptospira biflexa serovar Patoc strain 'Patoc 1 (Paris)']
MNWNCNDKNKFHEIKILVHDATKIIIVQDRLLLNSIFFFDIHSLYESCRIIECI